LVASSTSASAAGGDRTWTIRGLIAAHRLIALAAVGICALLVAMTLVAALGPKGGAVTDATTCSQWGSANWRQQTAYARRYVQEHGGVAGQTSPAAVINAINDGCMQAFGEDVDDTTSVVQAISGNF
jgi:hypothetical protein